MASLIGRIVLQPTIARPGESVRVEVLDLSDNPFPAAGVSLTINGVPGAVQYLQFPTVGQRRLIVMAVGLDGSIDRQIALLDVQGTPVEFRSLGGKMDIAMIGVTQSATQPYEAALALGSFLDLRTPPKLSGSSIGVQYTEMLSQKALAKTFSVGNSLTQVMAKAARGTTRLETRRLQKVRNKTRATQRISESAVYDLGVADIGKALGGKPDYAATLTEYEWDFGDGTTAKTRTPSVRHDFFAGIDHVAGVGQFVITCHAKHSGITVKRSLSIYSAYALCKRSGTVVPHIQADLFAHKQYTMLRSSFTVYNVEDEPMVLDRLSLTAHTQDTDALALPRPFINLGSTITIPPHSQAVIGVNVPFVDGPPGNGQLRHDVSGFTVIYAGSVGTHPVRCSASFDVPVAEWSQKPFFPKPDLPDLIRKVWPWEMVQDLIDQLINPGDERGNPGDVLTNPNDGLFNSHAVTLDALTGTMAVVLGGIEAGSGVQRRLSADKLLATVYAPVHAETLHMRKATLHMREALLSGQNSREAQTGQISTTRGAKVRGRMARAGTSRLAPLLPDFSLLDQGGAGAGMQLLDGPPPPGFIAEGQICDPDNLSEEELALADLGQLVCQLTEENMEVTMPARWMNGRKGDVILSPGGDGLIGGLMLNVSPPQWYSHSGIMTRNYDEITHSTGSQSRLMDHMVGVLDDGTDGFEPSVLKYIWPGAITQTVEASIHGESFPDPEYAKSYSISAFGPHTVGVTHNDHMKMIPPLVLKPDPMQETPSVRSALHAIATDCRNNAGRPGVNSKYHYRWYCYTNPALGLGDAEGPAAGWAAGTRPSVCSSYIWMHATKRKAHLESGQPLVLPTDLEATDIAQGAVVRPVTLDGLYTYSAAERSNAAYWLFDTIYNQAYEKAGWFGEIITDAADDVANQFLNAFANDDADGKDSEDWKDVVAADAVSPDDMIWWDGPDKGGLYGYIEPAIYREPRIESYTVSRWKKVISRGTVRGRVLGDNGQPVQGALVQLYEGKSAFSGGDGGYSIADVPLGHYMLKAQKVIDGVLQANQINIHLAGSDLVVDVHLKMPAERYRIAQVFIDFEGTDEENLDDNEIHNPGQEYFELELGPDKLVNTAHRTYKWGGEVRMEYAITLRLLVNNTIDVDVQGTLYEGTSEDTGDLDGTGGVTFLVAAGATAGATLSITNTDEDDGDKGVLSLSVKNVRNNN